MNQRRQAVQVPRDQSFKGRQFTAEVILWAVRWYLMFPISYRDLELMLRDRGVAADHTTIFRWIQAYAAELERRIRPRLRPSNGSWRVDETYICSCRVKGRWAYLFERWIAAARRSTSCFQQSGMLGGQAVLPQGAGPAAHGEPAHDHGGQEPGLSKSRRGYEKRWPANGASRD